MKPGQSVRQPEYMRVEMSCDPSISAMEKPDRFINLASSKYLDIARRDGVSSRLTIRRAADQHELTRNIRFAAAIDAHEILVKSKQIEAARNHVRS